MYWEAAGRAVAAEGYHARFHQKLAREDTNAEK